MTVSVALSFNKLRLTTSNDYNRFPDSLNTFAKAYREAKYVHCATLGYQTNFRTTKNAGKQLTLRLL
jgi:hypothetical protein